MNTGMDDQLARCKIAEEEGWGLVVEKREKKSIVQAISEIVNLNPNNGHQFSDHHDTSWVAELIF